MADPFPIRPISADEYAGFRRVHDHAFNTGPLSGARAERAVRQFEPERSLAAMDAALPAGEEVVGTTGIYSLRMTGQPGFFVRDDDWWGRVLHDESQERQGAGPLRCLLAEDGSGVRGYAVYVVKERWDDATSLPDGSLLVRELMAADPAAGAALWHNLLDRDLITSVTAELRSADDPVLYQLLDQRRARMRVSDGIWVRIIDLPAALSRRAYPCPVDAVLDVTDPLLAGNAGRWRLRSGGQGLDASCERTDEPADVALDIRELGAAYLGGTRLGSLAAAGLVRELRPGALARLSAAMTWDPAPWCPAIF